MVFDIFWIIYLIKPFYVNHNFQIDKLFYSIRKKNLDISRLIFGEGRDAELEKYVENVFKKFDNDNSGKLSFQEWAWHFFSQLTK